MPNEKQELDFLLDFPHLKDLFYSLGLTARIWRSAAYDNILSTVWTDEIMGHWVHISAIVSDDDRNYDSGLLRNCHVKIYV